MPKQTVSASMSHDLVARLEARAEESGLSKSALVVLAVERMLSPVPSGADLSQYPPPVSPFHPELDAEPSPRGSPTLPPGVTVEVDTTPLLPPYKSKAHCAHPLSQRSGTVCLACGAMAIR